jgi:WD40 repeat protein
MKASLRKIVVLLWCFAAAAAGAQNAPGNAEVFVHIGNQGSVNASVWRPDGKNIAAGDSQGVIKVWSTENGREFLNLSHGPAVNSLAFSPDGSRLASTGGNTWSGYAGTLKVWDADTGRELLSVGELTGMRPLAWNPEGTRLVTGSANTALVLDAGTGAKILTLSGHSNPVNSVAFSPDGSKIITGSADRTVRIWNAATGAVITTFRDHKNPVSSVALSPNGAQALSVSSNETIVWNAVTGQALYTLALGASRAYYLPNNRIMTSANSVITILNSQSGQVMWRIPAGAAASPSPDGKQFAVVSGGGLKISNLESALETKSWIAYRLNPVSAAAVSPRDSSVAAGYGDRYIRLWDLSRGGELRKFFKEGGTRNVLSVNFSPDGARIAGSLWDSVTVWEAASGKELQSLSREHFDVVHAVYSADGKRILSTSQTWDGLSFWDAESAQPLHTFGANGSGSPALSPDGKFAAQGSWDYQVNIFETGSGREQQVIPIGDSSYPVDISYSPDGKQIALGLQSYGSQGGIKIVDAQSGEQRLFLSLGTRNVKSLAWSPDGKQILAGSDDRVVRLWDAVTGKELLTFAGHTADVSAVRFAGGGRRVVSASADGTLRVWDAVNGREIARFLSFTDGAWLCLTPEGYYTASPGADDHLSIRINGQTHSMEEYRAVYNKPDLVANRLAGK